MQYRQMFGTPIFKTKFQDNEKYKEKFLSFLNDPEVFKMNTRTKGLKFSHPNLHMEKVFEPIVDFINDSLSFAYQSLGFVPSYQLTGMWSTRQPKGGNHHRHSHGNTLLAGVYYLDGENNTPGTNFYPMHHYNNIIIPAKLKVQPETAMKHSETTMFEEGTLIIFPGWQTHDTSPNRTNSVRTVLAFNSMPIGKTNSDPFDRFYYKEVDQSEMINYTVERFDV